MADAIRTQIRHVACGKSDLFATAAFKQDVTLWSLSHRTQLADFTTGLDYGGRRLVAIDEGDTAVVAGAYSDHGIAGYDRFGARLWHRGDLEAVQHVTPIVRTNDRPLVGVGLDHMGLHLLDLATGQTTDKLQDVRRVYAGRDGWLLGIVGKKEVCAYERSGRCRTWNVPLRTFTVLDAALSDQAVLYSEVRGMLRCFSRDGVHLWDAEPGRNGHALSVAWNEAAKRWLYVTWPYLEGGDKTLVVLDADGRELFEFSFGASKCDFFGDGAHLVHADGRVIETLTGKTVWNFIDA